MRVAMLSKALVVGTYQRKAEEIARETDIDLVAIVPPTWREPSSPLVLDRQYTEGYELVVSPIRFDGHFHLFHFAHLGHVLEMARPDLLHVDEEPYNLACFLAAREAARQRIPYLFFTWQNLDRSYPPPFSWLERYVYRHAAWAVAGSDTAANVLRAKGFRGPSSVIPQFGVDPELFAPDPESRQGAASRPFTIGYAGRLVREKGVDLLIEACAGLAADFRLVILGRGAEQRALEVRVGQVGLGDRVIWRGAVPSVQMADEYRQFDAVVLPSRSRPNWREQFGRVLVEAMACGVPVVGSTCGEVPAVIGDAGLLFPEGNADALRAALQQLIDKPGLAAELAERGRLRVLERFTHRRIAQQTAELYREIQRSRSDRVKSASIG